jgi:hypothetical protein
MDHGPPTSYLLLTDGTPVLTATQTRLGTVKRVLADLEEDIFDGLIVETDAGERFVDASRVAEIYERAVELSLSDEEAAHLPEPTAGPAAMAADPDDTAVRSPAEEVGRAVRRVWDRISGNY